MSLRYLLALVLTVHRILCAASELCVGQCGDVQADMQDEGWDTLNSAYVHIATFALGCAFSKWLNRRRESWNASTMAKKVEEDLNAAPLAIDTELDETVDALCSMAGPCEPIVKKELDITARSLANIFEAEIALEEEKVAKQQSRKLDSDLDNDADDCGFRSTARGLAQIFKDGLSDDEETSAPCSPTRSEASSLSPPSPPSPSPESSPLAESGTSVHFPVEEADLDSLLLLRGVEASLATRVCATTADRQQHLYGVDACNMSSLVYLSRLHRAFKCSNPCFVIAVLYMDKVRLLDPDIEVSESTWHKLFSACLVLALKFHDDDYRPHSNAFYAQASGIRASELNEAEAYICRLFDWNFCVAVDEYTKYSELVYSADDVM